MITGWVLTKGGFELIGSKRLSNRLDRNRTITEHNKRGSQYKSFKSWELLQLQVAYVE